MSVMIYFGSLSDQLKSQSGKFFSLIARRAVMFSIEACLSAKHYNSHQYINVLVVRASVRDGCGRGRNEFEGRVQNHHVHFSFHRNGHFLR